MGRLCRPVLAMPLLLLSACALDHKTVAPTIMPFRTITMPSCSFESDGIGNKEIGIPNTDYIVASGVLSMDADVNNSVNENSFNFVRSRSFAPMAVFLSSAASTYVWLSSEPCFGLRITLLPFGDLSKRPKLYAKIEKISGVFVNEGWSYWLTEWRFGVDNQSNEKAGLWRWHALLSDTKEKIRVTFDGSISFQRKSLWRSLGQLHGKRKNLMRASFLEHDQGHDGGQ